MFSGLITSSASSANEMLFFLIAEFERAAKVRKIAVYRFLICLLAPELWDEKMNWN